jgi:hypothetical protein
MEFIFATSGGQLQAGKEGRGDRNCEDQERERFHGG